nr:EOG090X0AVC [Eulimnadia texana]
MMSLYDDDMADLFGDENFGHSEDEQNAAAQNSENEDNEKATNNENGNEMDEADNKTKKKKKETGPKRVAKNPQPKLDPDRLCGPRGIIKIEEFFKDVQLKGKGHEKHDLDTYVKKIRMDMIESTSAQAEPNEEDNLALPSNDTTDSAFDSLFQSNSNTVAQETENFPTPEQRQRMEENRRRAAERKRLRELQTQSVDQSSTVKTVLDTGNSSEFPEPDDDLVDIDTMLEDIDDDHPRGQPAASGSDIRKFFTAVTPKSAKKDENNDEEAFEKPKKKKAMVIESDSDEDVAPSKKKVKTEKVDKKSPQKTKKEEEKAETKLKKADAKSVFGDAPISRSKAAKKSATSSGGNVHDDSDFTAALKQLDSPPANKKAKTEDKASKGKSKKQEVKKEPVADEVHEDDKFLSALEQVEETAPSKLTKLKTPDNKKNGKSDSKAKSPAKAEKEVHEKPSKSHAKVTKKETKEEEADTSVSHDPAEKRKQQASNYAKFLQSHRQGAKNPGSKTVPEGKEGCMTGLTIVVTGVLDSLQREEAEELVKKYGGKATHSVSSRTSYILAGEDAGPSKLSKAKDLKIPVITEDEFLNMIATHSPKAKPAEKTKKEEPEKTSKAKKSSPTKDMKKSPPEKDVPAPDSRGSTTYLPWVEKYKPTSLKQIIGQQGDRSNMRKLSHWLQHWYENHSGTKKLSRPSPWAKDDNGAFFKAALLSGPPGIGKTTTAHLVSKELGYDVVEMNASDTRSKRLLQEHVSELLSSQSLASYAHGSSTMNGKKRVLIMDEVDGMAGNEDRGGVQELIALIKKAKIPIVCICNDRSHPKMRSLVNYCFDLRFSKPRLEQIRGAMLSICYKEGIKIKPEALDEIILGANQDVRQVLSHLSVLSAKEKTLTSEQAKVEAAKSKKDFKLGPWDVVRKVFSAEEHKNMSLQDKSNLFFQDYSFGPLFVQENYLLVQPHAAQGDRFKTMDLISKTAESISQTDLIERTIRSQNAWSLLPAEAVFASVVPGELMEGHFTGQIAFPAWFGKNSRQGKMDRLLQELHLHMRLRISASKRALNMDYLPYIINGIVGPLRHEGTEGAEKSVKVMENYDLLREDLDSLLEVGQWPEKPDLMAGIDGKVKAAFTRLYNKESHLIPYSAGTISRGRSKASTVEVEDFDEEEGLEDADEDEEDEDVEHDAMIKVKKAKGRAAATEKKEAKASTSRGGGGGGGAGRGRGRGRGGKK